MRKTDSKVIITGQFYPSAITTPKLTYLQHLVHTMDDDDGSSREGNMMMMVTVLSNTMGSNMIGQYINDRGTP